MNNSENKMTSELKPIYPKNMLPEIDYNELENPNFFSCNIVDLEYGTMDHLYHFVDELTKILNQEKMVQSPEIMIAHLCSYLGYLTSASINPKKSPELIPQIHKLIESEAEKSYQIFSKYLIDHHSKSKEEKEKQFSELRNNTPSSIVAQTLRLGRDIIDSIDILKSNSFSYDKNKIFCPPNLFLNLMKKQSKVLKKEWRDRLSMLFVINQICVQIGWVMGYYGFYDKNFPKKYLEFGLPCIELFSEYGLMSSLS
ncbi:hypothetical protein [Fluviispira vulneris]|uniref:hypothetical protein n=1 Tax=Fluviispira vulneris TaxID=2763012 RepID=UPI00164407B5|nr:hypothetical protein [Fluviispira vulneris]